MIWGFEAILYYLFVLDSSIYFVMAFSRGKLHKKTMHWYSNYAKYFFNFPINRGVAIMYLALIVWIGLSLSRLGII
ncbi:MAG: hypothetical protein CL963_01540 [Euryarchaeota archaeon]|jgi:hypothetical protein|nr:hypothetical protein [Euryarchaeota archaeon]|tara:strand:+ start:13249 stop:13476 length:228 start_codon:yes stop_codon:yes gene_type:complete